jgi:hypothetical protein
MPSLFQSISTTSLACVLATATVFGQDTRAGVIAEQQAEKAQRLEPNVTRGAEKFLEWVEGHFTSPNEVYLTFGGMLPSSGFGPGVAVRQAWGHARFNAGVAYSVRSYKTAQASLRFPELAGEKLEVNSHVRWDDGTQVPYYGIGNDTTEDSRVNFGIKTLDAGGSLAFKPARWFRIGGGMQYRRFEDRAGEGSHPSVETIGPVAAPGLFQEARYRQSSIFSSIDWRESPGYTRSGGLYSLVVHDFNDSGNQFSFRRFDAEVQQYLPLLNEHWVLVFRGLLQAAEVDDDQLVPYYLLPSLGGARRHRGFSDFRFHDQNMMLVTGEYRWTPSRVIDMALFVDAGKVTNQRRDLNFNDLKTAYGIGIRIHGPTFTPLRLDLANSSEGLRIHITGGAAF